MKEKDHLFRLVHSMKAGEHSYYKKVKKAFRTDDSYDVAIFNIILKQDEFNEEKIIKELGKELNTEFYACKKHNLFDDILDILNFSRFKRQEVFWQINRHVVHGIILKEKLMFDEAAKTFDKGKKLALENEMFSKAVEINQHLIEILVQSKNNTNFSFADSVETLRNESIQIHKKAINAEEYFLLADSLYRKGEEFRLSSSEKLKLEINEILSESNLEKIGAPQSNTAKATYHYIMYLKFINYEINLHEALTHLKQLIQLQNKLKRFSLRSRAAQMGNYIVLAIRNKSLSEAEEMYSWLENAAKIEEDALLNVSCLVHKALILQAKQDDVELQKFVDEIEKNHMTLLGNEQVSKEALDLLLFMISYYINKNEFKKACKITNRLDKDFDLHSFKNIKLNLKLVKLWCFIELKEDDLILSEIRAIKYMQRSLETSLEIEDFIFNMLERLSKLSDDTEKQMLFSQYLNTHEKLASAAKYSFIYDGLNFTSWVNRSLKIHINRNLKKDSHFAI